MSENITMETILRITQVFCLAALVQIVIFAAIYQLVKTRTGFLVNKREWMIVCVIFILLAASLVVYGFCFFENDVSNKIKQQVDNLVEKFSTEKPQRQYDENLSIDLPAVEKQEKQPEKIDAGEAIIEKKERFVSKVAFYNKDDNVEFVEEYYRAIAEADFQKAYDVSCIDVDYEEYASWYENTTKIVIENAKSLDEDTVQVELVLYEGDYYTVYKVELEIVIENNKPLRFKDSKVEELDSGNL